MFIYLFVFIVFLFFCIISYNAKFNTFGRFLFQAVAIFILVFFSASRDVSVGKDITGAYGVTKFNEASNALSLSSYLNQEEGTGIEIGYLVLNYACACISDDIGFFLGALTFLVVVPIILSANKLRVNQALFLLFFFCLLQYNLSLSMLRQSVSVSWIMYGTTFLMSGRNKWLFFFCVAFAFTFHSTSLIAIVIPLLMWITKRMENVIFIVYAGIVLVIYGIYLFFRTSLGMVILMVSDKYDNYLNQTGYSFHKVDFVLYIGMLVLSFLPGRKVRPAVNYVRVFLVMALGFIMLGSLFETANRLVLNFYAPIWLFTSSIFVSRKMNNLYLYGCAVFILFAFVYFSLMPDGYAGTIPYSSKILGI